MNCGMAVYGALIFILGMLAGQALKLGLELLIKEYGPRKCACSPRKCSCGNVKQTIWIGDTQVAICGKCDAVKS